MQRSFLTAPWHSLSLPIVMSPNFRSIASFHTVGWLGKSSVRLISDDNAITCVFSYAGSYDPCGEQVRS